MLKKKDKAQFESPDRLNRLVAGTRILGDILSESSLRIDGEVIGNISTAAKVVIGETGILKGNLNCAEADIEGTIEGKLFIDGLLILRESSKIYGDIQTVKLHMEEGAVFEGACKMGNSVSPQVAAASNRNAEDIIY
jgi:cytoskeletal protein CcmA (bactofilin family)